MKNYLKKDLTVLTSICDNTSRMSIPSVFSLFMDMATEHGTEIKLGFKDLSKKGCIWLTSKTKVKIHKLPEFMDKITCETWPEAPGRIRCNRFYALYEGDTLICEGKSEWAIINVETQKLTKLSEIYPEGLTFRDDKVCDEPFERMSDDFENAEFIETYKIRSTDIDLSRHMNNVAYVKMIFGSIPTKELNSMEITDAEILFKSQSYENEKLTLKKRINENGFDIAALHSDGTIAVIMRFKTK